MSLKLFVFLLAGSLILAASFPTTVCAAAKKQHSVVLGASKRVSYSKAGDPSGAQPGETELRIRALIVDGNLKEWTTGDPHDITDRSFVVRRALRINDTLPSPALPPIPDNKESKSAARPPAEKSLEVKSHWVWQRGPWLLVDRVTGHISALKLPEYDPGASQPVWFRDLAAYCGVTASGKSLHAIVAQLSARKPLLSKKLADWDRDNPALPACAPVEWKRDPLNVTFHVANHEPQSFSLAPGSAVLVEETPDEGEPTVDTAKK